MRVCSMESLQGHLLMDYQLNKKNSLCHCGFDHNSRRPCKKGRCSFQVISFGTGPRRADAQFSFQDMCGLGLATEQLITCGRCFNLPVVGCIHAQTPFQTGALNPQGCVLSSNRKRLQSSHSSQSSDLESSYSLLKGYAGAKFASPPSPKALPLPPLHWRIDASVPLNSASRSSIEISNAIKGLLGI